MSILLSICLSLSFKALCSGYDMVTLLSIFVANDKVESLL